MLITDMSIGLFSHRNITSTRITYALILIINEAGEVYLQKWLAPWNYLQIALLLFL